MTYAGREFRPISNTSNGEVSSGTLFLYEQQGDLLSAAYSGGGIRAGQMLGLCDAQGNLHFCYHHVTDGGELRSGVCESRPEILAGGRIRLQEQWRWTHGGEGSAGSSVVDEVTE